MSNSIGKSVRALVQVLCVVALARMGHAQAVMTDQQLRLDRLVEELEAQRVASHIPGMAIVVVKDDEIVLARGFGLASIEEDIPVTSETIFAIGSSTKAFTTTLVAMLVDEGLMGWNDPAARFLPELSLAIDADAIDAVVTIRDMLCHRTGFTRMSILWAANAVPRDEVLRTASGAEPWAPFRKEFHYNNVMYMAAGMAAGRASGLDYESLLQQRLIDPLNMGDATLSVSKAQQDDRLALGYQWDEEKQDWTHLPMRHLDVIGPAGCINAHVLDMAQWLRLQLGRGGIDGQQLVSEEQLRETWTKQIDVGGDVGYGLGWMTRSWNNQPVLEHGGNIDGFGAQVALLPESNLGFVLLTNVTASPLQGGSINMVWEALLGDLEEPEAANTGTTAPDFDHYLGKYVADFGSFDDMRFTVLVQNGNLAVDVPGQMIYELKPPDEEGKWYFALTDAIAISFGVDDEDQVVGMNMYQAGMKFELPREGVGIPVEIPLDELRKYVGTYRFEELGQDAEVLIQNNRLAIDIPGEMTYELHPPDDEGRWVFRVSDLIGVVFANEGASVSGLTLRNRGREFTMQRIAGAKDAENLPTTDELLKMLAMDDRHEAVEQLGTWRIRGKIRMVHSGVEGVLTILAASTDRHRQDVDLTPFGTIRIAVDATSGATDSSFQPFTELTGELLEQARLTHPGALWSDWRDFFDEIEVTGEDDIDGRPVLVIKLRSGDLATTTAYIDRQTGDAIKADSMTIVQGVGAISVESTFDDYRSVGALRIPFKATSSNQASGRSVMQFEAIETNLKIGDGVFSLTPPPTD